MDSDCDYLLYSKKEENSEDSKVEYESCLHCSYRIQDTVIRCTEMHNTPAISLDQALTGRMVPYLEVIEASDRSTWTECKLFNESETSVRYVKDGNIISLQGAIHMQDVPLNGTWLSDKAECKRSVLRLRLAGLMAIHLPELNRVVLEQKNDDGLLYLVNKWLLNKENVNEGIELFGPFTCDAMLAPVLHEILRSEWITKRKDLGETNNELKLGWAQEFYNWKCLMKNSTGSTVFAHNLQCPIQPDNVHGHRVATLILDKMRWCGYTPWSAVHAVRCSETRISRIRCPECRIRLLTSCAFLMECAAVEASRDRDWLVRNEAVIQLCWLLYQIHKPHGDHFEELLEAWTQSTVIHSIRFVEYKRTEPPFDIESLVVIFANDHLPFTSNSRSYDTIEDRYANCGAPPDSDLLQLVERNERFSRYRDPVVYSIVREDDFNISIAVEVLDTAPEAVEARAQEVDVIAQAIVSCFPRVAALALDNLTLKVANTRKFWGRVWPLFVNSTRMCYRLFRSLALPVSPSPVYMLELLARGWRCITRETLQRFIPMSTGGTVKVSHAHYAKLVGPLSTLHNLSLMSKSEMNLMIKVLSQGVLPCFAAEGDSAPDRVVNSTVALTFAACGLRVFECDEGEIGSVHHTVTFAGLLYFAAWYVLVYMGTLHLQPTLKEQLSRIGSDSDKHLCAALNLKHVTGGSLEYEVHDFNGGEIVQALRTTFSELLNIETVLRVAELYVPELLVQLPYAKKLDWIPGNVRSSIESRDIWFTKEHGDQSCLTRETPFEYLGNIAEGLHSSIKGSLTMGHTRPIAQAPRGPDDQFDPWCGTLMFQGFDDDESGDLDDSLRNHLHDDHQEEIYYTLDDATEQQTFDVSLSLDSHIATEERPHEEHVTSGQSQLEHDTTDCHCICKGLVVSNDDKLGFDKPHKFLTVVQSSDILHRSMEGVLVPAVKHPCMMNIASTVYTKTQKIEVTTCPISQFTLIGALWVLLMRQETKTAEPSTPDALAVMVHLAVKHFKGACDEATVKLLRVCNDIEKISTQCNQEAEFIPIVAITGGLFGLNVELNVNGYTYHVTNEHYRGTWAPGSICYRNHLWYVQAEGVNGTVSVPPEPRTVNCYHTGTLGAYIRLNGLKVDRVSSDDYCGFHTAAVLLGIIKGDRSDPVHRGDKYVREMLSGNTAAYMMDNKHLTEIQVYLDWMKIVDAKGLVDLFMTPRRWLTVDEVTFILKAHNRCLVEAITENSYPIYNPECTYFLIKSNHFEPVTRNV